MDTAALTAALVALHTTYDEALDLGGHYFDWSTRDDDGRYVLEVGITDGDAVQVALSPDDMRRLHAGLALTLLRDAQV
jgi:hypothetical protein